MIHIVHTRTQKGITANCGYAFWVMRDFCLCLTNNILIIVARFFKAMKEPGHNHHSPQDLFPSLSMRILLGT